MARKLLILASREPIPDRLLAARFNCDHHTDQEPQQFQWERKLRLPVRVERPGCTNEVCEPPNRGERGVALITTLILLTLLSALTLLLLMNLAEDLRARLL